MKKRPLIACVVSYIIGILWGLYLNIISIAFFVLSCLFIYRFAKLKQFITMKIFCMCILFIFLGFTNIEYTQNRYNNLYLGIENQSVEIVATVVSDKEEKNYYDAYKVKVEEIVSNKKVYTKYKNTKLILYVPKNIALKYGSKIKFFAKYQQVQGQRNYKGFNYRQYLNSQGIYGTLKLTSKKIKVLKENNINFAFVASNKFKQKIEQNLSKILKKEESGLILGMLIGDTSGISENVQIQFQKSSLTHLLAVSGSNVSYVVVFVIYILNKLKVNKRISYSIAIIFIIFFIILTGMSSSVIRAGIMGIVMLSSKILFKKLDIYTSLAFSLFLILLFNPLAILDVGLQLSFAGTLGIVVFYHKILNVFNKFSLNNNKLKNIVFETLSITISAQIAILPIMACNFNNINLIGIISNLFAVPISGIITVCAFIVSLLALISFELSKLISPFLYVLLKILIYISEISSKISFLDFLVITPNLIEVFIYYAGAYVMFYKYKEMLQILRRTKCNLKIIIILLVLTIVIIDTIPKNLRVNFIDVGQGDSTLIRTPYNKKVLVDGGGNTDYDVGQNILLPYILDRRIKKIDYIIISHFDSDHCKRIEYSFRECKG